MILRNLSLRRKAHEVHIFYMWNVTFHRMWNAVLMCGVIWCIGIWKKKKKSYSKLVYDQQVYPFSSFATWTVSRKRVWRSSSLWRQAKTELSFEFFENLLTFNISFSCFLLLSPLLPPLCFLSLPVLLHCDSESDSPSTLRIECSFMIVPPLSNQLNRLLVKLSEIMCTYTVKITVQNLRL